MTINLGLTSDWRGSVWRKAMWAGAAIFLAWPAVAMLLEVPGVNWDSADFVVMGALLAAAGFAVELGMRMSKNFFYRAGVAVAIGGAFLTIWINLAVGAIGSEDNPANLLYGGVLLTGLVGAVVSRMRPKGLAWTLLAMAAGQVLVPVAVVLKTGFDPATPPLELIGVTVFFLGPWLLSAALFALAARQHAAVDGAAAG